VIVIAAVPTFSEPAPRFNDQIPQFNPEEEDEQFGGDLDFPDPSSLLEASAPALQPPTVQPTVSLYLRILQPQSHRCWKAIAPAQTAQTQLNTPPNLRVFPQDTASVRLLFSVRLNITKPESDVVHLRHRAATPPSRTSGAPCRRRFIGPSQLRIAAPLASSAHPPNGYLWFGVPR
jgi:hypothetical protein